MKSEKLRGLVLGGGESRRMGQDKGLIASESGIWANQAGVLLRNLKLPVAVMVRETQRSAYEEEVLSEFELVTDSDLPVGGPLKGLLSFHLLYPQNDVLALPCDMVNLTAEVLQELVGFYFKNPDDETWAFENKKVLQPLPGVYSSRMLSTILEKVKENSLPKHSLTHLLNSAKTARMAIADKAVFQNFNSPADF